ncbi:hypothetical protein [Parendozoicomonas haliclonae]|uniref:Ubiquitin carboxyl-terminal hydrolase n=1 Tax=Parendozoicomonas haliclonae TaxID=1960125 RepID=A0A1X7AKQ1_9GAMM|nr:hypothetical protein [Parendozoicomonas haliclonae]SMA47318.1 Ubiquitin carboxyl-terminal hydrolase [Parendozoicomonas haliclonae]
MDGLNPRVLESIQQLKPSGSPSQERDGQGQGRRISRVSPNARLSLQRMSELVAAGNRELKIQDMDVQGLNSVDPILLKQNLKTSPAVVAQELREEAKGVVRALEKDRQIAFDEIRQTLSEFVSGMNRKVVFGDYSHDTKRKIIDYVEGQLKETPVDEHEVGGTKWLNAFNFQNSFDGFRDQVRGTADKTPPRAQTPPKAVQTAPQPAVRKAPHLRLRLETSYDSVTKDFKAALEAELQRPDSPVVAAADQAQVAACTKVREYLESDKYSDADKNKLFKKIQADFLGKLGHLDYNRQLKLLPMGELIQQAIDQTVVIESVVKDTGRKDPTTQELPPPPVPKKRRPRSDAIQLDGGRPKPSQPADPLERQWQGIADGLVSGKYDEAEIWNWCTQLRERLIDASVDMNQRKAMIDRYEQKVVTVLGSYHAAHDDIIYGVMDNLNNYRRVMEAQSQVPVRNVQERQEADAAQTLATALVKDLQMHRPLDQVEQNFFRRMQGTLGRLDKQEQSAFLLNLRGKVGEEVQQYNSRSREAGLLMKLRFKVEAELQILGSENRALQNPSTQVMDSLRSQRPVSPPPLVRGGMVVAPTEQLHDASQVGMSLRQTRPATGMTSDPEASLLQMARSTKTSPTESVASQVRVEVQVQSHYREMMALVSVLKPIVNPQFDLTDTDWAALINEGVIYKENLHTFKNALRNRDHQGILNYIQQNLPRCRGAAVNRNRDELQTLLSATTNASNLRIQRVPEDGNAFYTVAASHFGTKSSEDVRLDLERYIQTRLDNPGYDPEFNALLDSDPQKYPSRRELREACASHRISTPVKAGRRETKDQANPTYLSALARMTNCPVTCIYCDHGELFVYAYDQNGRACSYQEAADNKPLEFLYDPNTGHFDSVTRAQPQPDPVASPQSLPHETGASLSYRPEQQDDSLGSNPYSSLKIKSRPLEERELSSLERGIEIDQGVDDDMMMSLSPAMLSQALKSGRTLDDVWGELQANGLATHENMKWLRETFGDAVVCKKDFMPALLAFTQLTKWSQKLYEINALGKVQPFAYGEFKAFYNAGLMTPQWIQKINGMGQDADRDTRLVLDLDRELLEVQMQKDKRLQEAGLSNQGVWMAQLGNTCWINSSLQMMLTMLGPDDIAFLKQKMDEYPHDSIKELAKSVIGLCEAGHMVKAGKAEPSCMVGHQKRFMDACHGVAKSFDYHFTGMELLDLFAQGPHSGREDDPAALMGGVMEALQLSSHPRMGLSQSRMKTTVCGNNKAATVITGTPDPQNMIQVPVPAKAHGLSMLADAIDDQAIQRLKAMRYATHEQAKLRDDFLKFIKVHRAQKTDNVDDAEGETRAAAGELWRDIRQLYNGVSRMDALIVGAQGQLVTDCIQYENKGTIPAGSRIPDIGSAATGFDYQPPNNGRGRYDGVVSQDPSDGSVYIAYKELHTLSEEQAKVLGTKQVLDLTCRGVAIVDEQGRLTRPCLDRIMELDSTYKPNPDVKLPTGQLMLDTMGRTVGELPGLPAGTKILDPDLKNAIRYRGLEGLDEGEQVALANSVAIMLGINVPREQLQQQQITMRQCLNGLNKVEHGELDWNRDELESAEVDFQDMPVELARDKPAKERGPGEKAIEVRRPTRTQQVFRADKDQFKKFTLQFALFDSRNGQAVKRGSDALDAFRNGGNKITLPMYDTKTGERFEMQARLSSVICHHGNTANSGHYINLTIDEKGQVTVQDDTLNLPLNEYAKLRGYRKPVRNVDEFLNISGFTPYMGYYHKVS